MTKKKIIIIDEDKQLVESVKDAFAHEEEFLIVATTDDGVEGIKKIEAYEPDLVLLDLILPNVDGIGVIKGIDRSQIRHDVKFVVTSYMSSNMVIEEAIKAGACFFIKKPTNAEIIKQRIKQCFSGFENTQIKSEDDRNMLRTIQRSSRLIDEKLNNMFLALGIPAHIKGFQYLKDAIKLMVKEPDLINHITKKLYPKVAELNNTEPARVERAIRHAIEVAWNKNSYDNLNKMIGFKLFGKLDKPTNGELIALIANKLIVEGLL